jgi:hypothetical protein
LRFMGVLGVTTLLCSMIRIIFWGSYHTMSSTSFSARLANIQTATTLHIPIFEMVRKNFMGITTITLAKPTRLPKITLTNILQNNEFVKPPTLLNRRPTKS